MTLLFSLNLQIKQSRDPFMMLSNSLQLNDPWIVGEIDLGAHM